MQSSHFIVCPRWLIPIEPAGTVLEQHAVVVRDGTIVAVLPREAAIRDHPGSTLVERARHALLPGLVNAHTHGAMTLFRGYADDMPLETWLGERIWPAEARWVAPDFVRDGADLALLEMLHGGTTAFADMYFYPDAMAAAVADSGLRASIGMIVLDLPTAWARSPEEYLEKALALRDQLKGHPRISTMFAPHAPYTVGNQTFERIRMLADELDALVHMHVLETATEIASSMESHRCRPLQRLASLGLLTPQLSAIHMTQLAADDISLVARSGANVVHCPESNLKLASGTCPVAELVAAGVNVALGTDGAASNNDLDMFGEMRTAALLAKGMTHEARALPASTILEMATLNGARALGIGDRVGSIIPGKEADFICVDLERPATMPVHSPVSQLVYSTSRDQVTDVWVGGEQLLEHGRPVRADSDSILRRAAEWGRKLGNARD